MPDKIGRKGRSGMASDVMDIESGMASRTTDIEDETMRGVERKEWR